jgi:hypothetical protein
MSEKPRKGKKIAKWFTITVAVVVAITAGSTFISNRTMKSINASRDTQLEAYELTSQWVQDDVRSYLGVRDEASYSDAKRNTHMTQELKNTIYGSVYDDTKVTGVTSVSLVDVQYTLKEKDNTVVFYVLANVTKNGEKKPVNVLTFVKNNEIYDIVAY